MTTFTASRQIPASPRAVFAAISDPERLARWWGPAGFTNTFTRCEFRPGGRWVLTMHGPDGTNYPNEYAVVEVEASAKVVVDHVQPPQFRLSIGLEPSGTGTMVSWVQAFADDALAGELEPIVVPANAQNLERLAAEVASFSGPI